MKSILLNIICLFWVLAPIMAQDNLFLQADKLYEELIDKSIDFAKRGETTKAIDYIKEAIDIANSQHNITELPDLYYLCGRYYNDANNHIKALENINKAISIIDGQNIDSLDYRTYYQFQVQCYSELTNDSLSSKGNKYGEWLRDNFSQIERILDKRTFHYELALRSLVNYYTSIGLSKGVCSLNEKICQLTEGKEDFLSDILGLIYSYNKNEQFEKSISVATQLLHQHPSLINDIDLYSSLQNTLSLSYDGLGLYDKAIELADSALSFRGKLYGEKSELYAITLDNLSLIYSHKGDFNQAIQFGQKACSIHKGLPDITNYCNAMENLSSYYCGIGDYNRALSVSDSILNILKDTVGESHPQYALALNNTAYYLSRLGQNEKALQLWSKALDIQKKKLGVHNSEYNTTLENLAVFYSYIGNYKKSIATYETILQNINSDGNSPFCLNILRELATTIQNNGDKQKALPLYKYIYQKRIEAPDAKLPQAILDLIISYELNHSLDSALIYIAQAENIVKNVYGEQSFMYARFLIERGHLLVRTKEYDRGIELERNGLKILETFYGNNLNPYKSYQSIVAYDMFEAKYTTEAIQLLRDNITEEKKNLKNNFSFLSESQRQSYWFENRYKFEYPIAMGGAYNDTTLSILAYDDALFMKNFLLNTSINLKDIILRSNDNNLIYNYRKLERAINNLSSAVTSDQISYWSNYADSLSNVLTTDSRQYGEVAQSLFSTFKDVQSSLTDKDVAIEFFYSNNDKVPSITASVIKKEWGIPRNFFVARVDSLQSRLRHTKAQLRQYVDVWYLLLKDCNVKEGDNIYFSPDGILNQIGIEYLPTEDGRLMSEKYNMYRLSSTRELCNHNKKQELKSAVLYGGLTYDTTPSIMQKESEKYGFNNRVEDKKLEYIIKDSSNIKRGGLDLRYLPHTLSEVDSIENIIKKSNKTSSVNKLTAFNGSEESFKALSGKSPNIIHIATHGYFLKKTVEEIAANNRFISNVSLANDRKENVIDYSMERATLAFSGAKHIFYGDLPKGIDDGFLTAKEISQLDLRNTDIVILSACNTAAGDITNDGVAGLQRGLKNAGVKSILMSLWGVDDKPTQLLMTQFYRELMSGKSKMESLRNAQRYLRNYTQGGEKIFSDPEYWAGFILLDGLD